jgi:hypothetical protein
VTLRREEAQTLNRYADTMRFGVSVIACDHRGCRAGYLVGIGEGDDLPSEAAADAESEGWSIDTPDYCPAHAAEHSSDADDDE